MPNAKNTGTGSIPLELAKALSNKVNEVYKSGELLESVFPITKELLTFWFDDAFCDERNINFHQGQKQAILNTIYCHEVLGVESSFDLYKKVNIELLNDSLIDNLAKDKYAHPKYCIKMATGTGKTWVINALLIWQYLNAKSLESRDSHIQFSKNFLLVAPGLIVYERLIESFLGKEIDKQRDFSTSDLYKNKELFIPSKYEQSIFGFIQNSVATKEEITSKITNDGIIAILNWQAFKEDKQEENLDTSPLKNPKAIMQDLLPITPGISAGHSLDSLDNKLGNDILGYLKNLENICVFNDEAHHIHENKTAGITSEVEWQKSLNAISQGKGQNFIQIDFSATPYDVTGSGQKRTKHYFPHIVADFTLTQAIHLGLVKCITLDKRKEFASIENEALDFKAKRDDMNKVLDLSDGQRLMLSGGLKKLQLLEEEFMRIDSSKHPKMLVICEDTKVSPLVGKYLCELGLNKDDIMQIDSNTKGELKEEEWKNIKRQLFNIDKRVSPKVIISVLMLREGFDVSNICVIVPLRSSQAPILLEQVIGRGLRLMWREVEYSDIKRENLERIRKKQSPNGYFDILSIIEHPAYLEFYEDLENIPLAEEVNMPKKEQILGDMIKVGLKQNYQEYDFYIPNIIADSEEILKPLDSSDVAFKPFVAYKLSDLKLMFAEYKGETFIQEEMTSKTNIGEYSVDFNIFNAQSYNEFLAKVAQAISTKPNDKSFPMMQINLANLIALIDKYIKHDLFGEAFNPLEDNNWRILMFVKSGITEHIRTQINAYLMQMQSHIDMQKAKVKKEYFSQIKELKMRQNFALDICKSIYEKTPYPSNNGGFEKDFLEFCDKSSEVNKILKIHERYHTFAHLTYLRDDGLLAHYCPDFIVQCENKIYLIETKAQKDINNHNVKAKQISAVAWCEKINKLDSGDRMECEWNYYLLDDNTFYLKRKQNASLQDMLFGCRLTQNWVENRLF